MRWSELRGELWARAVLSGVTRAIYTRRVEAGLAVRAAVDSSPGAYRCDTPRARVVVTRSGPRRARWLELPAELREAAEARGYSPAMVSARLRDGWAPELAVTAPRQSLRRGVPLRVVPDGCAVSRSLYLQRIARGVSPEDAARPIRGRTPERVLRVRRDARDAAGLPPAQVSAWERLTDEQRAAARALGVTRSLFLVRIGNPLRYSVEDAMRMPPRRTKRKDMSDD